MSVEKLKTINIRGNEYVTVSERVRYFNEHYKSGSLFTKIIDRSDGVILMKAIVIPDIEKPKRVFTAYAQEVKGKGMVNSTSYIENCETSAIGRALGFMGIGVESSIASADEVSNAMGQQTNTQVPQKQPQITPPRPKDPRPKASSTNKKKAVREEKRDEPPKMPESKVKKEESLESMKKQILEHDNSDIKALLKQFGLKSTEQINNKTLAGVMLKVLKGYENE